MNIRNNKGITLMAEAVTILLLLLIMATITYSSKASMQIRSLNNMYADIIGIQEKAMNYYLKTGTAPVILSNVIPDSAIDKMITANQNNPYDSGDYYKIDFSVLPNLSLNNKQTDEYYYYMDEKTLTVYSSNGVTIDNLNGDKKSIVYYTVPSNYENVGGELGQELLDIADYQN